MWSPDRRRLLLTLAALPLAGCGFAPVYGTSGGGGALLDAVALAEPETTDEYVFNRRFEERLGRGLAGPYRLETTFETSRQGLGSLADGRTTRYRLLGEVAFVLREAGSERALIRGRTDAFTGYSATGSTVATESAERDAEERLMILLADQVIDRLLIDAETLPA
ncbi:LPS assembly lipoprotein LptE [Salipiger mucosus]|uniref:Lipoprotein n=1 Tax=Salipiger mucosus DSM 16094 TaxID=1123237 RepID=S9QIJ0_9RHOB|nr:LPS assembly lipoprotein LptE [Salipiger mucosus]EPX79592.1 hypothetical protein Salmuc_05532 [Salipiger mucosus DSM 16094]